MTDETDTDEEQADGIEWAEAEEGTDEDLEWADEDEAGAEDPFPAPADESDAADAPLESDDPLADEEMEEAFDDVAVDDVDADEVWADVTDDGDEDLPAEEQAPADERVSGGDISEVSKHDYCEGCEFFSQAPEIHCTHEGTEILDFTDMETVRVSNCPIVAERRGLEQGVSKGSTDLGEIQRD